MGGSGVVLVGRDVELGLFDDLLAGLVSGRGGVGWVEGEPGIGKSALVDAVVARAVGAGCVTLVGRGDEAGQAFPLRVMADCLRGVGPGAAGVPSPSRLEFFDFDAADPVWAAGERMLAVVDRLCADRAVVLVAEDLHWADEWSLGLWGRLAGSVDQIPLLLVGTCRPVPERAVVARLRLAVTERGGAAVDLGPLGGGAVAGMASVLAGGSVGGRLAGVLAQAGGNPLYVRELLEALVADGLVRVQAGVAELVSDGAVLPDSLVASITRRLRMLSAVTYRALHTAALLGTEFGVGEWIAVTGHSADRLAQVVDEAVTAGVLSGGARGLVFRHELIRQVLVQRTPVAVRAELHRQIARLLAAGGQDVDVVAAQLVAAPGLEQWAVAWLAQRPEALVLSRPQVWADLLDRAVGLIDKADPWWEVLAARLADVWYRLGRVQQAGELAEAVVAGTEDGELAGRMRVRAIRAAGWIGQYELALARGEAAAADPRLPAHWQARAMAWTANALRYSGHPQQAVTRALEALDAARRHRDPLAVAYACLVLILADPAGRASRINEALANLGDDPESQDLRILILNKKLSYFTEGGQWDEYDKLLPAALVLGEEVGGPRGATAVPLLAIGCSYLRGQWDEALLQFAAVPAEYRDDPEFLPHGVVVIIALLREDHDMVDKHMRGLKALEDNIHAPTNDAVEWWAPALSVKAEIAGDLQQAVSWRTLLLDLPAPMFNADLLEVPDLVRLALDVGDLATATAAAAACQQPAETPGTELQALVARLCHAQLADDANQLLAVADRFKAFGAPPLHALGLEEAAVRLARNGAPVPARKTLNQAVQVYADLGATWNIKRADARLRALGVQRGSRSLHRRATHGWESLTPTQLRIAELVAKGMSNPDIAAQLFISRTTVQTHVSTILAKLDMHSRVELILHHTNHNPAHEAPQR